MHNKRAKTLSNVRTSQKCQMMGTVFCDSMTMMCPADVFQITLFALLRMVLADSFLALQPKVRS